MFISALLESHMDIFIDDMKTTSNCTICIWMLLMQQRIVFAVENQLDINDPGESGGVWTRGDIVWGWEHGSPTSWATLWASDRGTYTSTQPMGLESHLHIVSEEVASVFVPQFVSSQKRKHGVLWHHQRAFLSHAQDPCAQTHTDTHKSFRSSVSYSDSQTVLRIT